MWYDRWCNYSYYNNLNDLNSSISVPNNDTSSDFSNNHDNDNYSDVSVESNDECVFIPKKMEKNICWSKQWSQEGNSIYSNKSIWITEIVSFLLWHAPITEAKKTTLFVDTVQKKKIELPLTWCLKVIMVICVKFNRL